MGRLEGRVAEAVSRVVAERSPRLRALAQEIVVPLDGRELDLTVREVAVQGLRERIRADPELDRDAGLAEELIRVEMPDQSVATPAEAADLSLAEAAALDQPVAFHPDFADGLRLARLYRLTDSAGIAPDVATVLAEDLADIRNIGPERLAGLVDAGRLTDDQARVVGTVASLYAVLDEHEELAGAIAPAVRDVRELARYDASHWTELLQASDVQPPADLPIESYARLLVRKFERLFPATALAERLRPTATAVRLPAGTAINRLRRAAPDADLATAPFEVLDADAPADVRTSLAEAARLRDRFPGLGLGDIIFAADRTVAERRAEVNRKVEHLTAFLDANPDVLARDLTTGSRDLDSMVFPGIADPAEQPGVVRVARAYQRMLGVTDDLDATLELVSRGFASAVSIAETPADVFALQSGLPAEPGQAFHAKATEMATRVAAHIGTLFEHLGDGSIGTVTESLDPQIREFFTSIPGYTELFGSQSACRCSHCQSIFGPAAYFVDLMEFIDANVTRRRFAANPGHPLSLRSRRPDLWSLELTCANTNTPIPYLDIINPVLARAVASASGFAGNLADEGAVAAHVFGLVLPDAVNGFEQPFHLAFEELKCYLGLAERTPADLAEAGGLTGDSLARLRLGFSPKDFTLAVQPRETLTALRSLYGVNFVEAAGQVVPVETGELLLAMGLTRAELSELTGTSFVTAGGMERVTLVGEKLDPQSVQNDVERVHGLTRRVLDRMHRFVRLWRSGSWRIPELDLLLTQATVAGAGAGIDGPTLRTLGRVGRLQEQWGGTIEEICALWSPVPTQPVPPPPPADPQNAEGDPPPFPLPGTAVVSRSLFDRLFNPVGLLGSVGAYPQPAVTFVHPAMASSPSPAADEHTRRLVAATGVGPDGLWQLILGLADALGIDPSSAADADKGFLLDSRNLTLLYRHAALARMLQVSVTEIFALIAALPEIGAGYIAGLDDLEALLSRREWQRGSGWSAADLVTLTGASLPVGLPAAGPAGAETDQSAAVTLVGEVARTGALTFDETALSALPGLPPAATSAAAVTGTAAGDTVTLGIVRDALVSPDEQVAFGDNASLPAVVADWNSKAVATRAYRATADGHESPGGSRLGITLRDGGGPGTTIEIKDDSAHLFPVQPAVYAGYALGDDDSLAIVAANAAHLEVYSPGVYRLAAGYDVAAPPLLPARLPAEFRPLVKAFFDRHHSRQVMQASLPGQLLDPPEVVAALMTLAGEDLDAPELFGELRGDTTPPSRIARLLARLRRASMALAGPGFGEVAVDLAAVVSATPAAFGLTDVDDLDLLALESIVTVRTLLAGLDPATDRAGKLTRILASYSAPQGFPSSVTTPLAEVFGCQEAILVSVSANLPKDPSAPAQLRRLSRATELAEDLGVSGSIFADAADTSYSGIAAASAAVQAGGRGKAGTEERWTQASQLVSEQLRSRRRDGLAAYLLRSAPTRFRDKAALYDYFLLDVELEGCMMTSKVASAIDTTQLYVQRCLMNLEQSSPSDPAPVHVLPQDIPALEWEGRKSYREWEIARRIYSMPENFLDPDLRDDKTHLFRQLEDELLAKEVTEESILAAYSRYLRGFDELSHLTIAGSYHEKDTNAQRDVLHLLGATSGDTPVYFYRRVENVHYGVSNAARPTSWGAWEPLDIQIPVSKVSPVVFQGQLYVFWVRYTTSPMNTLRNGESIFSGYQHRSYVEYSRRRLDGTWTPPQRIRLTESPFDVRGDGVILDPIVPKTLGLLPVLWFNIPIFKDFQPYYDTRPHEVPKNDYSLRGFRWDQVFAASTSSGVSIRGADFQMWSPVDFYQQRIGRRYDEFSPAGDSVPWLSPAIFFIIWVLSGGKFDLTPLLPSRLVWSRAPTGAALRTLHSIDPGMPCFDTYSFASLLLDEQRFLQYTAPPHALTNVPQWPTTVTDFMKAKLVEHRIADVPVNTTLDVVNGSVGDVILQTNDDALYIQHGARSDGRYLLRRLRTTVSSDIAATLFSYGIDRLLETPAQLSLREHPTNVVLTPDVVDAAGTGDLDYRGPAGVYLREIFFHVPMLIASYFNSQGRYEDAERWYKYVFDPTSDDRPRTDVTAVAAAQEANGRLHLLQLAGGRIEYAARRSDDFWESIRFDVASVTSDPGTFTSISTAVDPNGTVHVLGVTADGGLWHTLRSSAGVWQPYFGDVRGAASAPGQFAAVACTTDGEALHVVGCTRDGGVWHTIRAADTSWLPFGDVKAQIGDAGPAVAVGCSRDGARDMHVCITTADGQVWHTIRYLDGSWQAAGWGNVTAVVSRPGTATAVACTAFGDSDVHVVVRTSDGGLWHTVRHPASWDVPFRDLRTVAGQLQPASTATTAVDGTGVLTVIAAIGGAPWSAIRLPDGAWRPMHPAGVQDRDRPWRYREFRDISVSSLRQILTDSGAISTYRRDPFNPHAIARMRLTAYMKSVVMAYADNLLDGGDDLYRLAFSRSNPEYLRQATLKYVTAQRILGRRPDPVGDCGEGPASPRTFTTIQQIRLPGTEFLMEYESYVLTHRSGVVTPAAGGLMPLSETVAKQISGQLYLSTRSAPAAASLPPFRVSPETVAGRAAVPSWADVPLRARERALQLSTADIMLMSEEDSAPLTSTPLIKTTAGLHAAWAKAFAFAFAKEIHPIFCIPSNTVIDDYRDRVEDRLYKIRHCLDIEGVPRQLPLFAPQLDVGSFLAMRAAGVSLDDVLAATGSEVPPHRFQYLVEKAKVFTEEVQKFGASLVTAMEKKEAEELASLRDGHEKNILKLTSAVRDDELTAAQEAAKLASSALDSATYRYDYYTLLLASGLSGAEVTHEVSMATAAVMRTGSAIFDTIAAIAHLVPEVGSPFSMKFGGKQVALSSSAWSMLGNRLADVADATASISGTRASFERREQDWRHQQDLAKRDVERSQHDLTVADVRVTLAERAIEIHRRSVEQNQEVLDFYHDKFTSAGLYMRLSKALQKLHREAYLDALAIAMLTEEAYHFERPDDLTRYVGGEWDAAKAGLSAGEQLKQRLLHMERRFVETTVRADEVSLRLSLQQFDPAALVTLKQTGQCTFDVPEFAYDLVYPGQYRRRIKNVRLTVPCVGSSYSNVGVRLSQLASFMRARPVLGEAALTQVPPSRAETVATSSAKADGGVFEFSFTGEQVMPFEGGGAVSSWRLRLPANVRAFDYETISDVILQVSYTALYDEALAELVELAAFRDGGRPTVLSRQQHADPGFQPLRRVPRRLPPPGRVTPRHGLRRRVAGQALPDGRGTQASRPDRHPGRTGTPGPGHRRR